MPVGASTFWNQPGSCIPRTDEQYLEDILSAAALIQTYLEGWSEDEFAEDVKTQDAVMRRLLVIGEAARQGSEALRNNFPDVPWADVIGMRNIVTHEYHVVSIARVWETAVVDVPELVRLLAREAP
jgi:uncharacterized protein with HEPN domain